MVLVFLVYADTAITDEADIRQYILELKNLHTTQRVVMMEPEDGAMSDRASTPDIMMEEGAETGRSRSRRYGGFVYRDAAGFQRPLTCMWFVNGMSKRTTSHGHMV